jgi:hypothetical protein
MEDWKAALGQAMSDLKQSKLQHPQANKERGIAESAPFKIKPIQEQAKTSGVTSGVTGGSNVVLPPKPARTPIFDRSQNSTVGKKPDKGTGRFPLAASKPVSNPVSPKSIGVRTEGKHPISKPLFSPKLVQRPATRSVDPTFNAPDMSKYRIRHRGATGATTQAWQEIGKFVVLNPGENRGRAQCTIGLDFGTAFTKACVQFRGVTYVVDWSLAVPGCAPSLLPGVFSTLQDGSCVLGEVGESRCGDLKIALMERRDHSSQVNTVVFLALATRYIRAWLFTTLKTVFSGFQVEWFVNVGLPTVPWEEPQMSALYEKITLAAWDLGTSARVISMVEAEKLVSQSDARAEVADSINRERIKSFPEFVAQIASYVQSAQRRNDLHLLVDVGAGTVDVVLFHIGNNEVEDDCFLIHRSSIVRHGTHILLGYRADAGGLSQTEWDEEFARLGGRDFEIRSGLASLSLDPVDDHFSERLFLVVRKLVTETKQFRYQTSPVWKSGLPFLLCGGGKDLDVYKKSMNQVRSQWPLLEMKLALPESFVATAVGASEFHRVSVAHGLSFSADNLGQIQPESEVPDIRRVQGASINLSERYIEK